MNDTLQQAAQLYKSGEKKQAAKVLTEYVKTNPNNATAWYGLALCLDDPEKKEYCLQRVISIDPNHQKANKALKTLSSRQHSEIKQQLDTSPKNNNFAAIALAIIAIIIIIVVCKNSGDSNSSPTKTLTPGESRAINAVQSQKTPLANDMHYSIGVVFVILENDGHTTGIDGWYVGTSSDHYSVKFYFYLDGEREVAEWWYYSDGKISPKNEWANVFMGH